MPLTPPAPVPIGTIATYDVESLHFSPGLDVIEIGWIGLDAGGNIIARGRVQATGGTVWWNNNHAAILTRLAAALGVVGGTVT